MEMIYSFNKWCWKNWSIICKKRKRKKCRHGPTPFVNINSKLLTIGPDAKQKLIKFSDENTRDYNLGFGNDFLGHFVIDTKQKPWYIKK